MMKKTAELFLAAGLLLLFLATAFGDTIYLPAALSQIEEAAFAGTTGADTVVLDESMTRIESRAFSGSGVRRVIFPENSAVEYIAPDAFDSNGSVQFVLGNGIVERNYVGSSGTSAAPALAVTKVSTYADKNTSGNDSMYGHVAVYFDTYPGAQNYRVYYKAGDMSAWYAAGEASASPADIEMVPDETYQFSVCALDASGNRITSLDESGYNFPFLEAPVITSVVRKSSTSVTVNWDPVPGAERYRVYYAKKGDADWTRIKIYEADGKTKRDLTNDYTSFTITGLTENAEYHFSVRCTAADGRALSNRGNLTVLSLSQTSSVMKLTRVLARSDSSTAHNDTLVGHVYAYWDEYKGASSYRVYCKEASELDWSIVTEASASPVEFELDPGENYLFNVCALNAEGDMISSFDPNSYLFKHLDAPVISSIARASATSVKICWDPVPGTECYRVYYAKSGDSSWSRISINGSTKVDLPATETSYTITGLTPETEYRFSMRCANTAGDCPLSCRGDLQIFRLTEKSGAFEITKVSARADANVDGNDSLYGHVYLEWNPMDAAANYAVYYKEASQSGWTFGEKTISSSSDIQVIPGKNYQFYVEGLDGSGKVISSTPSYSFNFLEAPVITGIKHEKVSSTEYKVTISWDPVPGTECYRVYYAKAGADSWGRIKEYEADGVTKKDLPSSRTSYTITGLRPNTEYHFSVRCTTATGICLSNRGDMEAHTTPRTWTKAYTSSMVNAVVAQAVAKKGSHSYDGLCAKFVVTMCNNAGLSVTSHNANTLLSIAQKAGTLHTEGTPPKGAFVYWLWKNPNSDGKNYGHVAISLGGGEIYHAWDGVKKSTISAVNKATGHGGYIYKGWSEPEGYVFK